MAKKTKEQEVNLFYFKDEEEDKKTKKKREKQERKEKKKLNKKKKNNKKQNDEEDTFSFDDEIIIGVTRLPEPKKEKKKKNKSKVSSNKKEAKNKSSKNKSSSMSENKTSVTRNKTGSTNNKANSKANNKSANAGKSNSAKNNSGKTSVANNKANDSSKNNKQKAKKQVSEETLKKRKRRLRIIKYSLLLICITTAIVCTMFSPLFNIETITIEGNEKISTNEIISLSQINTGENTYKINKYKTINNIKENPYIDTVEIERVLPSEVKIIVKERTPSFLLEYANSYIYINNQGYILEVSSTKLELPIIQGQATEDSQYEAGNRLCEEDLEKLTTVLKIMEAAQTSNIDNLITRIDISNKQNYMILFETEGKIAYLGDGTNLSTRLLTVKAILEKEKGIDGEIFVDMDLNTGYPTFRQTV